MLCDEFSSEIKIKGSDDLSKSRAHCDFKVQSRNVGHLRVFIVTLFGDSSQFSNFPGFIRKSWNEGQMILKVWDHSSVLCRFLHNDVLCNVSVESTNDGHMRLLIRQITFIKFCFTIVTVKLVNNWSVKMTSHRLAMLLRYYVFCVLIYIPFFW